MQSIDKIKNSLKSLTKNSFIRSVSILSGGTIIGQAILALILPVLTRLYTPEDFGLLGIYTALLMTLSVAACLRLELAIPLPKEDADAANLLALSFIAATCFFILLTCLSLAFPVFLAESLGKPEFTNYLWLLPLGVWLTASYSILQFWSIRKQRFGMIARTQITRAAAGASTQAGLGFVSLSPYGLIIGHVIYIGLGSIPPLLLLKNKDRSALIHISLTTLWRNLKKHYKFPVFSVPEALLNSALLNLPMVIIATLAGAAEAGALFLAQRIVSIPIGLIGGNISRAYLGQATAKNKENKLGQFTRTIIWALLKFGIIPCSLIMFLSPIVFPWVFGPEWIRAGVMVQWLAPAIFFQFLASPVSTIFAATKRQATAFFLQLYGFISIIGALYISEYFFWLSAFQAFAISLTFYYIAYLFFIVKTSYQI